MLDILERDGAAVRLERIADLQLRDALAERVDLAGRLVRARQPLVHDFRQHVRRALMCRALHVMGDAADAAHLLAAAGAAGAAMDEHGARGAWAGQFLPYASAPRRVRAL